MKADTVKVKKDGKFGYRLNVCIAFKAYSKEWSVSVKEIMDYDAIKKKCVLSSFEVLLGGLSLPYDHNCETVILYGKQLAQFTKFLESFNSALQDIPPKTATVKIIKSLAEHALAYATR